MIRYDIGIDEGNKAERLTSHHSRQQSCVPLKGGDAYDTNRLHIRCSFVFVSTHPLERDKETYSQEQKK